MKLAALQPLGDEQKASAVPQQPLQKIATAIEKQEKIATHGFLLKVVHNYRK